MMKRNSIFLHPNSKKSFVHSIDFNASISTRRLVSK
jgi:hypothetical protein